MKSITTEELLAHLLSDCDWVWRKSDFAGYVELGKNQYTHVFLPFDLNIYMLLTMITEEAAFTAEVGL